MIGAFTRGKDTNLKERTYQAISELETEIKAMYSLRSRLQLSVYDSLASAMKSHTNEAAIPNMEDYDELVNLLNIVKSAEIMLQNLSVKIDSAKYLQELVTILDRALISLRVIKSDISRIVPAIDTMLGTISNSIIEVKAELKIEEVSEQGRTSELPATLPENVIELPAMVRSKQERSSDPATMEMLFG